MHSMQQLSEEPAIAFDLAVIGSGPGGYEAALRAAKAGMKVCLIEKGALGGVCVNWGCIPTKALLRSAEVFDLVKKADAFGLKVPSSTIDLAEAVKRSRNVALKMSKGVAFMLRRAGVEVRQGEAVFSSPNDLDIFRDGVRVEAVKARHIIIASGAHARTLPGLEPDGTRIITSREALALKSVPASMIVVGGGAIGVEMAWFYAMAGTAVTLVELMPRLLPLEDEEIAEALKRSLQKAGITVATGSKLENVTIEGATVTAHLCLEPLPAAPSALSTQHSALPQPTADCPLPAAPSALTTQHSALPQPPADCQLLTADYLLVAVGVTGNCSGLGLEHVGVETSRGFIVTDSACRTSVSHIFAIGDVRGGMLLAHKASAEAAIAVQAILGAATEPIDDTMIPRCVYAEPSVASIGLSEKQAEEQGYTVKVGRAMFAASGKANAYGNLEGLVKLVFNAADGRLLGAHVVGHGAVELIGELTLARRLAVTAELLSGTIHAHPTLSETIKEAAENALQE
jgi:dihydrolipoamide dehydrogenase